MRSTARIFPLCVSLAAGVVVALVAAAPARAQDMMQLTSPPPEYKVGHFKYVAPQVDGWRQIANLQDQLSLVYIEQKPDEGDKLDTRFGIAMESHEIPAGTVVESAASLAELSRRQMAEARKADLVAQSPIQSVPGVDNLYTYRLLVHSPIKGDADAYEVYYVVMSPDKKEYIVIQCITKSQIYENEMYFQQFYGSLASLKYMPPTDADAKSDKPAGAAAKAGSDKPAGAAAKPKSDKQAGEQAAPPAH